MSTLSPESSSLSFLKSITVYGYVLILVVISLVVSLLLLITGYLSLASQVLKYTLIIGSLPLWYSLLRNIYNKSYGVDIIAGVALIGTFIIGHYLAGVLVLLMLSGGQMFEMYAMRRARKELTSLISRTPTTVHQKKDSQITELASSLVTVGMYLVIKKGEIVPMDGTLIEGATSMDESTLTGESMPVTKHRGSTLYAGTENIGEAVVLEVTKLPHETRYHSIIKLVQQAEKSKAPIVRLADHYSVYFTGITFLIALFAWIISQDLVRVVAVLVVATPCPLLLATPIAIMTGMSKSSSCGVIIKDGGALETLSRVDVFVFDKTGTLTLGTPKVSSIIALDGHSADEIIRIAASLDQLSDHLFARALALHAHEKTLNLTYPSDFKEHFGDGVSGVLDGTKYTFGKKSLVTTLQANNLEALENISQKASDDGTVAVFLSDEDRVLGAIVFEDILRKDAGTLFRKLRQAGVKKTLILTGDKKERAASVASSLHVTDVISECLPEDKLHHIKNLKKDNHIVAMIGDGINDAPALASADVGIALGTHGQTAASDAADIVILSSSITRVSDVYHISKQTIRVAKQGIFFGIGASIIAMILSAYGHIPPLAGVILQEGIDVVVILNALRFGLTSNPKKGNEIL